MAKAAGSTAHRSSRRGGDFLRTGAAALVALTVAAGCTAQPPVPMPLISQPRQEQKSIPEPDLVATSYKATDDMLAVAKGELNPRLAIIPTSFVDMNDLDRTSPMGRLLAQQMASRLTQHGLGVTEVKMRKNLLVKKGDGEFILTRDHSLIRKDQKAQAVLSGEYSVADSTLFVSAQLIHIPDSRVLGTVDYTLPLTKNTRALLGLNRPRRAPEP